MTTEKPNPHCGSPAEPCRQLTAFQAPAFGCGNAPAFVLKAEMEPSRAEGSSAPPSPPGPKCQHPHTQPGLVPTAAQGCQQCCAPAWHTDALLHTATFPFPRWTRGTDPKTGVSPGTGTTRNSLLIFQGSWALFRRAFLTKGLRIAYGFLSTPSQAPTAPPDTS